MEDIQEIMDFMKIHEEMIDLLIALEKKLGDNNE